MATNRPVTGRGAVSPVTTSSTSMWSSLVSPTISVTTRVPPDLDLGVREGPLLHDLAGPELVAAHDQGDLRGELGEERGLLDGRVAAADDRDLVVPEEEPVARGAGRHAVADQPALVLEAEHQRLGAGGDDERPGPVGGLRGVGVADPHAEGPGRQVDPGDLLGADVRAEPQGLLPEAHHELGAHDPLGEAGEVLDLGGQHQLAAGLVGGGRRLALDHQGGEVGPGRVDGRGEAGRAGPDDDHVVEVSGSVMGGSASRGLGSHGRTSGAGPVFRAPGPRILLGSGGAPGPGEHAHEGEDAADEEVGRPGVLLADDRVGQVHVEGPDGADREEDGDRGAHEQGEHAVHEAAGHGDGRAGGLVADRADDPLDGVGGLGRPIGGVDLGGPAEVPAGQ